MGFFNRYKINDNSLECSYREYNEIYCNPKDYLVTTDECDNYLNELINANLQNKVYNEKRRTFWKRTLYTILAIIDVSILAIINYWLYKDQSTWVVAVCCLILVGTIGFSVLIINSVERYLRKNEFRWDALYPKVNQNIEKLFDDYLWKWELIRYADKKGGVEKQSIYDRANVIANLQLQVILTI